MPRMIDGERFLSPREAAEIIGCQPTSVNALIRRGKLTAVTTPDPHVPVGSRYWIHATQVLAYAQSGRTRPRPRKSKKTADVPEPVSTPVKVSTGPDRVTIVMKLCAKLEALQTQLGTITEEKQALQAALGEALQAINKLLEKDLDDATKPRGEPTYLTPDEYEAVRKVGML